MAGKGMAQLFKADGGYIKNVRNIGWLLRHADDVKTLMIDSDMFNRSEGCALYAKMQDGTIFYSPFASLAVCREWVKRPSLRHVELVVDVIANGIGV